MFGRKQYFYTAPPFETEWLIEVSDKTITLPLSAIGTYDFVVDWGDGSSDTITVYNQAEVTHTYTTEGAKTVKIQGDLDWWLFNNGGDKLKITSVVGWGSTGIDGINFDGCANLTSVPNDNAALSNVTSYQNMFRSCSSLDCLLSGWDMSGATTLDSILKGCTSFNSPIPWDVSGVGSFNLALNGATLFNQDLSGWDISSATFMNNMLDGTAWSTANYDAALIAWEGLTSPPTGITFGASSTTYTSGGAAEAARTSLDTTYTWTFADGGPA